MAELKPLLCRRSGPLAPLARGGGQWHWNKGETKSVEAWPNWLSEQIGRQALGRTLLTEFALRFPTHSDRANRSAAVRSLHSDFFFARTPTCCARMRTICSPPAAARLGADQLEGFSGRKLVHANKAVELSNRRRAGRPATEAGACRPQPRPRPVRSATNIGPKKGARLGASKGRSRCRDEPNSDAHFVKRWHGLGSRRKLGQMVTQ